MAWQVLSHLPVASVREVFSPATASESGGREAPRSGLGAPVRRDELLAVLARLVPDDPTPAPYAIEQTLDDLPC
jgi:hypothetical protein